MGAAAMLLPAVVGAYAASKIKRDESDYPELPSIFDPTVYSAGDVARRRASTSGQAQGKVWSAEQFVTSIPTLMGK